ncbi:MAG: aminotransferase class V-fold PLP-dependent enzyme [Cellulophaga sp.]
MAHQKHLFSLSDSVVYLNGAYMSPQLKSVEAIGVKSIQLKNTPYEVTPQDFFTNRVILKKRFATLIQSEDYNDIAIIPSASYGIATVANNITLKKGDEILLIEEQFPSNVYAWKNLVKKYNAVLKIVKPVAKATSRGESWNKAILDAINVKTAVVAMGHVHWADGTLFDLKEIRKKTNEINSLLIIDGTQSVGALPFSVAEIQPDALICAGYKWLLGPYSLGVAYYGAAFKNGKPLEDNWLNRKDSENFSQLVNYQDAYQPKADRYCVGESSNFILVPMLINAIEQLLKWQPENIQAHCKEISKDAIVELQAKGCFIEKWEYRSFHLFGIYLPDAMNLEEIKQRLLDANIYVSYRGKAIRISCNMYNTKEDFDKLLACF